MARPRTQFGCVERECDKPANTDHRCWMHHKRRQRKTDHLRCGWPGCDAHQSTKGRRMGSGRDKIFLCRLHEVEHLRPTADVKEMNLARLGAYLKADGDCWIWTGRVNGGKYPVLVPEGANKKDWLAHRVVWDLLLGGHRPKLELDHCYGCKRLCCNPAHLEPVTRGENERRKRNPKRKINKNAAVASAVVEFAERFALPLPAHAHS